MALRIGLFTVGALLLGAHFLREGNFVAVGLCGGAPFLFFIRDRWILVPLQIMAYGAAASWIITLLRIIDQRELAGRSWTAAALILGAVALLSLLAGLLLNSRAFRARYPG